MKLVSKVTEIYCIADDFCKEYHSELNKTSLSLSNPSANSPKHRKIKGRMSDAEMITILSCLLLTAFNTLTLIWVLEHSLIWRKKRFLVTVLLY